MTLDSNSAVHFPSTIPPARASVLLPSLSGLHLLAPVLSYSATIADPASFRSLPAAPFSAKPLKMLLPRLSNFLWVAGLAAVGVANAYEGDPNIKSIPV